MPSVRLTDTLIRNLLPIANRQTDYWDEVVSGLILRTNPGGSKTFQVWYVSPARQARRLKLGRYPIVTLLDARKRALEALALIAGGQDPVAEKQMRVLKHTENLFPAVARRYIETHAKPNTKDWGATQSTLMRNFVERWSHLWVGDISRQVVQAAINEIASQRSKSATNHAVADLRALFNWAVEQGLIASSPCTGIGLKFRMPSRDRVLSDAELMKIWGAAEAMGYPYGHFIRLLIVTGQRRQEVAALRWSEINFADQLWTLPKERTKAARQHDVHLSKTVLSILGAVPRLSDVFVFPARGSSKAISGFSKWKAELDQRACVKDWRLHDLRRTAASGMARLGFQPQIIGRVLNHASGGMTELQGIYNRHSYLPETRDALTKWADAVEGIVRPRPRLAIGG